MADYHVVINFKDATKDYNLPLVQSVELPKEGIKATVIEGTRGDGSIVIPGGKKSQTITVKGILANQGNEHKDIVTAINLLNASVTTNVAVLKKTHKEGLVTVNDWSYTVRRIDEIDYPASFQTYKQEYTITFLVLAF